MVLLHIVPGFFDESGVETEGGVFMRRRVLVQDGDYFLVGHGITPDEGESDEGLGVAVRHFCGEGLMFSTRLG